VALETQPPVEVVGLTKRFGPLVAVDRLSFTVQPGRVCGFLGPNGAGKSTTLRCALGLMAPSAGEVRIDGRPYTDLADPVGTVGAVLDDSNFNPGRSARDHLLVMCAATGRPDAKAAEMLALVGLQAAGDRRVGGFSTGMRQRLGLAAALIGDPQILVLDEPSSGLDPAGINWLRDFLRHFAHERGRSVLVSSHLLAEIQHTADDVVIIAGGRLVKAGALADLIGSAATSVRVSGPDLARLETVLEAAGCAVERIDGALVVRGSDRATVGRLAFVERLELSELAEHRSDLEDVFLALTNEVDPAAGGQR